MSSHHWIRLFASKEEMDNYVGLNTFIPFTVKGENICVTRTKAGVYAFQEKCPHNGASLTHGFCTAKNEIVCPLHRYSFDLESGRATSGGGFALKKYPLDVRDDGVYVGIKAKWWEA
jgi:nitrite reductase/ring-hydroxylating ferredoxin subunit